MKILRNIMILTFIVTALATFLSIGNYEKPVEVVEMTMDEVLSENIIAKKNITLTYYNPVKEQCDNTPLITADGSKIDIKKLNAGKLRWCAVSRDLLQIYSYGDEIWIESENPEIRGYWVVKDTMNHKKENSVDLLLPVGHKTGFGKEYTYVKRQLPRYLVEEFGWEIWKESDPQFLENTLSDTDGAKKQTMAEEN